MRMRTGRFRARVVRAIGVETKLVDNVYTTANCPAFSSTAGLVYALVDTNSQGAASGSIIGKHIFVRSIQLIYSIQAGYTYVNPTYTYQSQPVRVKLALLRLATPGSASGTYIPYPGVVFGLQSGSLTGIDGRNLLHLPRRVQDTGAGATNINMGPSSIKVLKTWIHTVKPWDNLANTFQDRVDTNAKTVHSRKVIIKINQDVRFTDVNYNASTPTQPQYWLAVWRDDFFPYDTNNVPPLIQLVTRMSYYDV